jgi:hypothetical protein
MIKYSLQATRFRGHARCHLPQLTSITRGSSFLPETLSKDQPALRDRGNKNKERIFSLGKYLDPLTTLLKEFAGGLNFGKSNIY